ncbi:MAG: hypothetical protein P8P30_04590 [Rickettsiales bacterium]|nr:hypothetical protein [Rickettsiales bacterium]
MLLRMTLLSLLFIAHFNAAYARPVSYPGGVTVMQMNNGDRNSLHLHYSPTAKYSIGYKAEYWRDTQWQFHGAQLNYLVKRWNAPQEQANFYIKSGAGIAYSDFDSFDSKIQAAGFTGLALDWETRRYFAAYENRGTYAGDIDSFFTQKARLGIAPYIGNYGDLHTWLMLELEHQPEAAHHYTVTPLIRLFKGETMIEAGMSNQGEVTLNGILRF